MSDAMKKSVSGLLIFSMLLFLFAPFPAVLAVDEAGQAGEENTAGSTSCVLATSAGVYADPSLSGEPLRVLQKNDEIEIIADAGRTVVEVRFTDDNGEPHTGFMSRSAFEAAEGWPGEAVRQYVADACIRIGLMSAEIRYEEDDFSLARYRAEIKDLYRQRTRQAANSAAFSAFLLRSLREVGLVSEDSFPSAELIANWAVSCERNVIVWDGEETSAAKDVTDRARQLAGGVMTAALQTSLRFAGDSTGGFPIGVDSIVKYKNKFDPAVFDALEPGDVLLLNNAENIVPYAANGRLSSRAFFGKEDGYCINEGVPRLYSGFDKVLVYVGKGVSGEHLVLESDGDVPENVKLTALGSERVSNIRMVIRSTGYVKSE